MVIEATKLKDAYSLEWRRQWHPTPVLLPGISHGWRSLVGCSPWGREELDTTEVPMYFTKLTGGSKYAERGAMIGLLAGIILTPIGMIAGSFLGAFIAEVEWGKKSSKDAFVAALGSFFGFLLGTGIKTIASVLILWQIIVYAF